MQNSGGQPNAVQNQITANFEDGHRSALHCFAVFTLRGALSDIEHCDLHFDVGFVEHQHGGWAGGDGDGDGDGNGDGDGDGDGDGIHMTVFAPGIFSLRTGSSKIPHTGHSGFIKQTDWR